MEEYKGKMGWDGNREGHFGPRWSDGESSRTGLKTCDPSPLKLPGAVVSRREWSVANRLGIILLHH